MGVCPEKWKDVREGQIWRIKHFERPDFDQLLEEVVA